MIDANTGKEYTMNSRTGQIYYEDPDPTGPIASPIPGMGVPSRYVPLGEVRIKDPNTGGEKGQKLARFDLIPTLALKLLAEVYGRGTRKYADRNWEKGYAWGLSIGALERHFNAWKGGEAIDEETGCYHLAQVAWHAFTLLTFSVYRLGTDDRSQIEANRAGISLGKEDRWHHPDWFPALPSEGPSCYGPHESRKVSQ